MGKIVNLKCDGHDCREVVDELMAGSWLKVEVSYVSGTQPVTLFFHDTRCVSSGVDLAMNGRTHHG